MSDHARSIYVQIEIHGALDRLWQLTQTPDLHRQWDLRFTDIEYLPRPDPTQPQRFLYATRIGLGLNILGEGETVGSRDSPDGQRTSALRFWSEDRKSLIREGSGYWKYVPANGDGRVYFLTSYDYSVRFGRIGRLFDKLVFRPMLGWATAWSFDRLRLWIERGFDPAESMRRSLVYLTARLAVAFVWLYQGIVPKLIFRHPDELAMLRDAGLSAPAARIACVGIGCFEVAVGLALLLVWRSRVPLWLTLVAMPIAALAVAVNSPRFLVAAFNPVVLNLSVFALSAIACLEARDLPSARRCVRRPPRAEP